MNIEEARSSIGKPVLLHSHMPKLIAFCKGDTPHGPFILERITKGGFAMLKDFETRVLPRLLTLSDTMPKKSFHRPPPAPYKLMLDEARHLIGDLSSQVLIHCVSAHYRSNLVSLPVAAKACNMSEDDFRRAQVKVDEEARRMLMEMERLQKEREEKLKALEPTTNI